jgi:iron complex outermembrane receptor protein
VKRSFGPSLASLLLAGCCTLAFAAPSFAQTEEPLLDEEGYEVEELVVTASGAPRGAVIGDIPPEITLSPREIRAYGVGSVAELLEVLEPQTASARGRGGGRPVVLLNGMRTSGFSEVRDLPTEAIARVEILPEEVALKYGYRADQRVVNIVLRQRFKATAVELGATVPTAGGRESLDADVNRLSIQQDSRLQLGAKAGRVTPLLETERDIIQTPESPFRTLAAESRQLSVNGIYSRPLRDGVGATINGSLDYTETESGLGYVAPSPLRRMTDTINAHLGVASNGAISGWRWSFTGAADRGWTDSTTQRLMDAGGRRSDTAQSVTTSADAEVVFNGTLMELPAGEVSTALTGGLETRRLESESERGGIELSTDLSRHIASAQANIDVPIARRDVFLGKLGDLSANGNLAVDQLSDFGTMVTVGGGLNWSPVERLRMIASVTQEDGPPSIQQLGDPEVVTPGVRVFDYQRGETVEVAQISGGNPDLAADQRRVLKLGFNYKPFEETNLTLRADYTRSVIEDAIASFPSTTAEIEAAFPERFVRGADGALVQIDTRPVNFARQESEQLRWGFNYSKTLGPQRPEGGWRRDASAVPVPPPTNGAPASAQPDTRVRAQGAFDGTPGGGGFGGGRGFGGGGMRGAGALQFAVFHTLHLKDEILIRHGVPVLDLLNGSATGNGGQPRHGVDVQAGYSKNGYGARLNAKWQSGTEVDGGPLGEDLTFSDMTTVNLRVFADLGMQPWAREHTWLRGMRASLSVDNLFDERLDVRTESGATPISYQPDYIDPIGRTVRFTVRKLFFSFPQRPAAVRP